MKVEVVEMAPCRVRLTVKAEAEETREEYNTVVRYYMQKGRVPGFRPGKVPPEVIKNTFGGAIREEVEGRLIRKLYKKACEQEGIKVVNLITYERVQFSPETGMAAEFVADVRPAFDLPEYKSAPVKLAVPTVTDEHVQAHMARVRETLARFDKTEPDYAVQRNDLVCIDFEGKLNGQPLKEAVPEAAAIAEGVSHWMLASDEVFLPQLVAAIIGMRAGESKTVEATLEGENLPEFLKGQTVVYALTVKEVRQRLLPTEEEFLKQMAAQSMDAFRDAARETLTEHARKEAARRFESELLMHLLGQLTFDLPQSDLEEEIQDTLQGMAEDARRRGMTKEQMEQHRAEIVESATAMAKRQLRIRYLLEAIGDAEKVEVTEADMNAWIDAAAADVRMKPAQLRARIEKNGHVENVRMKVRNKKVLKMLVDSLK